MISKRTSTLGLRIDRGFSAALQHFASDRLLSLALGLLLVFSLATPVVGAEIEVVAEGVASILNNNIAGAEKQALLNAHRRAVEQGLGVFLDSKTKTKNFQLIEDRILSTSSGFVTDYQILSKGRTAGGQSFRVKIRAKVARDLLKNRLSALNILHKAMGDRRVMVIYKSENPNALVRTHGANQSALQAIRQALSAEGFHVVNEAESEKVYRRIERAGRIDRPDEDVIAMALDQKANLLVRFENIAGKRGPKGGLFSAAKAFIRISVHDTSSAKQIADAQAEGKQLLQANAGPWDWEKGLSLAAEKASRQAIKKAIDQIVVHYRDLKQEGFKYTVTFRNFTDADIDMIVTFMESDPNFSQLANPKFGSNGETTYMEVVVTSTQPLLRVDRILRAGMKEKGLTLKRGYAEGYVIVFTNPNIR